MSDTETPAPTDARDGVGVRATVDGPVVNAVGADDRGGRTTAAPSSAASTSGDVVSSVKLTRRGRLRKWDRPPPPRDWRWAVGNLGKVLIALGVLMFGFVAYQLWGTGLETAAAQRALEDDFEELLAAAPPVVAADPEPAGDLTPATDPTTDSEATDRPDDVADTAGNPSGSADASSAPAEPEATTAGAVDTTVVAVEDQNIPLAENGDAIARLEIPRIGVDDIVVAGVENDDLKKGPGHFPDTPLPGQLGNAAIAGHRTTYGQPFHDIDDLEPGDEIRVTTLSGVFVYRVTGQQIVSPSDYEVVATTDAGVANLTLTSCHPKWSASQRIVIFSELDRTESATVGEPVLNYGRPTVEPTIDVDDAATGDTGGETPAADTSSSTGSSTGNLVDEPTAASPAELTSAEVNSGIADAFSDGWFSDPGANPQVGLWGTILAAIAIGAYLISRRLRRDWAGLMIGIAPFVVALYFFFQNVNRLLPPNL